jgi:hypothetical protein
MNFVVSDSFTMRKTVLDTETNTDLGAYLNLDGDPAVAPESYSNVTTDTSEVRIDGKSVGDIAAEFITTYDKNAVKEVNTYDLPFTVLDSANISTQAAFRKVPNAPVYVYDGNPDILSTLRIASKNNREVYTLLVKNARLAVLGSTDDNALYIVPNGEVIFALDENDTSCDVTTKVSGLFMAGK